MGQPRLHLPGGHTILLRENSHSVRVEPIKYRNHPAYSAFSSKQVTAIKPIAKGDTIGYYGGRIVPGDAPLNPYQMRLRKIGRGQWSVDAQEEDEDNEMRYVNDAKGMDLEPNAKFFDALEYVIDGKYVIPELQALRNIEPGEEILVSYGPEYWREVEEAYRKANPFACPECDYRTNVKNNLYMHQVRSHKERQEHVCPDCEKIFKSMQGLTDHKSAVHSQTQLYSCDKCEYSTYRRCNMFRHKFVHEKAEDHRCFICKKDFKTPYDLNRHTRAVHKADEQPVLHCPHECPYKTTKPSSLARHINAIHKEARFHCDSCNFVTVTNARLQKHIRGVHLQQFSHHCDECDYGTMYSWDLKRHIAKHHA